MTLRSSLRSFLARFCIALFALSFLAIASPVFAQGSTDAFGVTEVQNTIALGGGDIRLTIASIIRNALGFLGVIAVGVVLFGGFVYMTAGGNDEKVSTAKKIMLNGGIGLVIILSSFAIAQFVLSRLADATGSGAGTVTLNTDQAGGCIDPSGLCLSFSGTSSGSCLAKNNYFVVEGITPNQDGTNMNNVVVRAVFSKPVGTAPEQVFDIQHEGKSLPGTQYAATFVEGSNKQVVEAVFVSADGICDGGEKNCLPVSEKKYTVKVSSAVKDANGTALENNKADTTCGSGFADILNSGASFIVNKKANDTEKPFVDLNLIINGQATKQPGIKVAAGKEYKATVNATDNSGLAYIHLEMYTIGGTEQKLFDEWIAPSQKSNVPMITDQLFTIASNVPVGTQYGVRATAQDIDHKSTTVTVVFTVAGSTCSDGIKNGDETGIDTGGSCGVVAGGFCESSTQCANGFACVSNACTPVPTITGVSPMDGAAGNWITISGKNFGTTPGKVEFGVVDAKVKPYVVDSWVSAPFTTCKTSWNESYIVVSVPEDVGKFVTGSKSAIRVTTADGKEDTTINNIGTIPAPEGLFTKNTTKRPGLCEVVTKQLSTAGKSKEVVHALGKNFGSTKDAVLFGGIASTILTWGDVNAEVAIPENMNPGTVGVQVQVAGEKSNAVPFTILSNDATVPGPNIASVDPGETTPGSYITIKGSGFGDTGAVYFNNQKNGNCPGENCVPAVASLPTACGDTWNNDQVIVQVPATIAADKTYYIVLANDSGIKISGQESVKVVSGAPTPSICALSPKSGPSPLPTEHPGLTLTGNNFGNDPVVHFFKKGADLNNIATWFSSKELPAGAFTAANSSIITQLPQKDGVSMPTGPIKVVANGKVSNSVTYEVLDCTTPGSKAPGPGYQCCTVTGPDKGLWKKDTQVCQGETRNAGYVWRFTTGLFPQIPYVIEECKTGAPASPSPWIQQGEGSSACINAAMYVHFSMNIDAATLNKDTVKVFTCGTEKQIDCSDKKPAAVTFDIKAAKNTSLEMNTEKGSLEPNTWYRVELSDKITGLKTISIAGKDTQVKEPLLKSRTCGTGTAYCYEFRTGQSQCDIKEVGILPSAHKASGLGIVQHPDYPYDDHLENPQYPLLFETWAAASQTCSVMDTDTLAWSWTTDKKQIAEAIVLADKSSHAKVLAKEYDPNNTEVTITASAPYNQKTLNGSAKLTINLANPQVVSYEPNCAESCINPQIRARFNRDMDKNTYAAGFLLFKCSDANCSTYEQLTVSPDLSQSTNRELVAQPKLESNTYYMVLLKDSIKSFAGLNSVHGKGLSSFSWFFKTQSNGTPCAVNRVEIQPNPFIATTIGQKVQYNAIPYSSPNACSKFGQALNKWDYSYSWKTQDALVASISHFPHVEVEKLSPACTLGCIPRGSDLLSTMNSPLVLALCGNGTVDAGEDCDIGVPGEVVNKSCSLSCLRPGNKDAGTCGNGSVDAQFGEQCDVAKDGEKFCTKECLLVGSGAFDPKSTGASVCGDGKVTKGESCDTKISGEKSDSNLLCTASCLHEGTPTAASWCESNALYKDKTQCINSLSRCGNNILEAEEECEADGGSIKIRVGGANQTITVDSKLTCSTSCRIQNVCSVPLVTLLASSNLGGLWCEKGSQGCSQDCRITGSSAAFVPASLCGDGIVGAGEYGACEVPAMSKQGESPVQIVTAEGKKQGVVDKQETTIQVTLNGTPAFSASGSFALQCGFTEYDKPVITADKALFNDCSNSADGVSPTTSCCLPRPVRQLGTELPKSGSESVCPNTAIIVTATRELKEDTLPKNIHIAKGFTVSNYDCATYASSSVNVAPQIVSSLVSADQMPSGFFQKMWFGIKSFFASLFSEAAQAESTTETLNKYKTWCTIPGGVIPSVVYIPATAQQTTSTKLLLDIDEALEGESTYAVLLKGGKKGITDVDGIGLRNPTNPFSLDDGWVFKTKKEICKIDTVVADPASFVFTSPNQEQKFAALAKTTDGQMIVPTSVYAWDWQWHPEQNPVFHIPAPGASGKLAVTTIKPKGAQGQLTASASASVTVDKTLVNNQQGKSFSAPVKLVASFCEHPWPMFEDKKFNFSMGYCPDAGVALNQNDDLPYLNVLDITGEKIQNTVKVKQCLLNATDAAPKTCAVDADCPVHSKLFNLPADDVGKNCESDDPLVLAQNNCTVYDLTGFKGICRVLTPEGDSIYPPQYGKKHRGCNVSTECTESFNGVKEQCTPGLITQFYLLEKNQCVEKTVVDTSTTGSKATAKETLKKMLFISNKSDDAVGLQIFANPKRMSAAEWFNKEFGGTGKTQPVSIGGYDGITDGSNYYINALNINKDTKEIHNNIYLFSVNIDAQPDTKKVFETMLKSLTFNTNLSDHGYCLKPNAGSNDDITGTACFTDFDCLDPNGLALKSTAGVPTTNGVCSLEKTKFLRDWKRLNDVKKAQDALEGYKQKNAVYPDMKSGTFIPGYSVSKWASWGDLSQKVGGLPIDPLNQWTQCGTADQATCWNAANSTFMCPVKTSVYEYAYSTSTKSYTFHVPFEFFNLKDPKVKEQLTKEFLPNPAALSPDQKCVPKEIYSPFNGSCGDGFVQPDTGEQCDPVGKKLITGSGVGNIAACLQPGQYKELTCNASCKWEESKACSFGGECGNAVVEGGEQCDDGALNGTYGHCTKNTCQLPVEYCGDGKKQDKYEECDFADPLEYGQLNGYAQKKDASCSASCKRPGPHCGDGVVQPEFGYEECDDGNTQDGDSCSATCKMTNAACLKEMPQFVNYSNGQSQLFITRLTNAGISEIAAPYLTLNPGVTIATSSTATYPEQHIKACFAKSTGAAICATIGAKCLNVYAGNYEDGQGLSGSEHLSCFVDLSDRPSLPLTVKHVIHCDKQYTPATNDTPTPIPPSCGNNKVDAGEACDQGKGINGNACTPAYGKSCTYCAADCKKILTVDPKEFCGNGKIEAGEACDFSGTETNQTMVFTTSSPTGVSCTEKGAYQCAAKCTQVINNCVACTVGKNKPVPTLTLLNPMVKPEYSPYSPDEYVELRKNGTNEWLGFTKINYSAGITEIKYFDYTNPFYLALNLPHYLRVDSKFKPVLDEGIETSALCKNEYYLTFNPKDTGKGDKFPYPVNGELAKVSHEVVMSSAVPQNHMRVVVRYTNAEADKGAYFIGGVYHNNIFTKYSQVLPDKNGKGSKLCTTVTQGLLGHFYPEKVNGCDAVDNYGIFIHPLMHGQKNHIQGFTIDLNNMDYSNKPFGFVVETAGPIAPYLNSNVYVDVYLYKPEASPKYSIYKPDYTFTIADAAGTSSNQLAKYWHVFTAAAKKGTNVLEIQPVNSIETNECQISMNLPAPASASPKCQTQQQP